MARAVGGFSAAVALFTTVTGSTGTAADLRLSVYTVNYPLQYFAERIGGNHVEAVFPAPSDVDAAFWTPDMSTIAAYQGADLILLNGAGYAKWVGKVSLPRRKLVDTSASFADQYIDAVGKVSHSHGPAGEHSHAGTAFTTWLDLKQAVMQAAAIKNALVRRIPQKASELEKNYILLEADLLALDALFSEAGTELQGEPLLASHPVYQYLARRYGLNIHSLRFEPDEAPSPEQWQELEALVARHAAAWMIWEDAPLPETVERLRKLGIETLVFRPCGNRPERGDFLSVMRENLAELRKSIE